MAIADLKSGKFESGREAARAYGVPPSTFKDRLNSKEPRRIAHYTSSDWPLPKKTSLLIGYSNRTYKDLLPYIRGYKR